MKLLLYSFVIFLLSACSNEEQRFVCSDLSGTTSDGLIIKNKEASFSSLKLKYCETSGTVETYSTDCLAKDKFNYLSFDIVSYNGSWGLIDSSYKGAGNHYIKCVKK
jgi:hypothetical protein